MIFRTQVTLKHQIITQTQSVRTQVRTLLHLILNFTVQTPKSLYLMQHLQIATTPENTPAKPKPTPIVIANPRNISLPPVILDLSIVRFSCCDYIIPRICALFNQQIMLGMLVTQQKCVTVSHKQRGRKNCCRTDCSYK